MRAIDRVKPLIAQHRRADALARFRAGKGPRSMTAALAQVRTDVTDEEAETAMIGAWRASDSLRDMVQQNPAFSDDTRRYVAEWLKRFDAICIASGYGAERVDEDISPKAEVEQAAERGDHDSTPFDEPCSFEPEDAPRFGPAKVKWEREQRQRRRSVRA